MKSRISQIWRVLFVVVFAFGLAGPERTSSAAVTNPDQLAQAEAPEDQSTITLDGLRDADYVQIASDPAGDLADPGPANWVGVAWTDLTALYAAADANNLYVYIDSTAYTYTVSTGRIGLAIEVDGAVFSGGALDPWGNAISFGYTTINGFETTHTFAPDYMIRGNIYSASDNGWTELRTWNGDWNTGGGVNWGGISGAPVGTHIAYADGQGIEFAIPLADIGNPQPADVRLQFFAGQEGGSKGAYDTLPSDDQSTGWDDPTAQTRLVTIPLAVDPAGDLADPGPANWVGVAWTDATRLHVWADWDSLQVYIPSPGYDTSVSTGQLGLSLDTKPGGGGSDPWGNAITLAYTATYQNLGFDPLVVPETLPDYFIRGNIFGPGDNGWTELRTWNGSDWNTGGGSDWGGIGNSGQPSLPGSRVAWSNGDGLRLTIPFSDIGLSAGNVLNLQFFGTQGGGGKGAYDTVPSDDQSTGWDDATTQKFLASYLVPSIPSPGASQDNNIWWDYLGHDSRDTLYRTPGGAVPAGTEVTLRLRAASNDLTAARVRVWNDRTNQQAFYDMAVAADDGTYEWWEAALPASSDPTIYWYRFIAIDGTATAYYEDDSARDGGWGSPFTGSPDYGWQLSMYDPAYQTPDWVKNAVIYQVFADRFRDGDPANNTPAGTFFYAEPGGTVVRSNATDWNTPVCDPREVGTACSGTYSKNFYGGDLQGLRDKLSYLADLGVTAIYLNPIFEAPSNHKYDTTDFSVIDDNFGDLATFEALANEAGALGIHIILDGVFNHSSSDSLYFDRYGRYAALGACESPSSPYRDWYYFTDVAAGSGPCAASDGTPNGAKYESWFGFDSLPKLRATTPAVRNLIWSDGTNSIAPYWVQWADGWRLDVAGDVDPGTTNDPSNDYWEGFRDAVRAVNPDTYIVGEEWNIATAWTLGGEWDATMNYQFSSAVLSFWRDQPFVDNDHNSGSSAGVLNPISPSQLEARLRNLQERYPPEAFLAMMNLLGSHDTNRPLFMLDHNAALGTDDSLLQNPDYDWSDPIERLRGVALLQMTMPGAPTVYYGDEVGLVGPITYDGSTWQDDPYNRQPFPWLETGYGAPFYTHLQSQASQDSLHDYYKLLIETRNAHPALRTGSLDTLLVDDTARLFAYGRKLVGAFEDAAVVVVNRSGSAASVTLDVDGYLPYGAQLVDVLGGNTVYTVSGAGELSLPAVPAMSGALLVLSSGDPTPPPAVTDLSVTAEIDSSVTIAWSAVAGATSYDVYRSLVFGGGYALVGNTASTSFTDSGLVNAQPYYYVVVSRDDGTGLVSAHSNEVQAIPHFVIGWANLQWPPTINHTIGLTPTEFIYGQVWIDGVTGLPGATPGLSAQVGYGASGSLPIDWTAWVDAEFNGNAGNNDEFRASLLPEETGVFHYVYRYSTTGGRDWVYADQSGPIAPDSPVNPGVLTVNASNDTNPPEVPLNLRIVDWGADFISLAWDPITGDPSLYAYEVFRSEISGTVGSEVGQVLAPTTEFTDATVSSGTTYYYAVRAIDTSFNRSDFSNQVFQKAEPKIVMVTFRVRVPDYTPGTVYIAGNLPGMPQWNPGATPLTQVSTSPNVWEITMQLPDGVSADYKYTRGSWDMVESWGSIQGLANRSVSVSYGSNGQQLIDDTATDYGVGSDDHKAVRYWRDPIVVGVSPADGSIGVPVTTTIQVTWSVSMTTSADFTITGPTGPVSGAFSYDGPSQTVTFTPAESLTPGGEYSMLVSGEVNALGGVQQVPYSWSFRVMYWYLWPVFFSSR